VIDEVGYEQRELIHKIRRERGTKRGSSERVPTAESALQDGLRSSPPGSLAASDSSGQVDQRSTGIEGGIEGSGGIGEGRDRGEGRSSTEVDQDFSSVDTRDRTIGRAFQRFSSGRNKLDGTEEKPSGLNFKRHAKEQQARAEQDRQEARREKPVGTAEAKKGLFRFLRSDNRGQTKETRTRPFTDKEAQEIKQPLLDALADYFTYSDEFIYATHKAHRQVDIWKTIDYEEMNVLVDVWLARAKRDAKSASRVVFLVNSHYKLKVGIILAPRFYQTFRVYAEGGVGLK